MKAIPRPIAWSLLLFEANDAKMGDPYLGTVTVTIDDMHVATLRNMVAKLPENRMPDLWDALADALTDLGATHYQRTRIKAGKRRTDTRPIRTVKSGRRQILSEASSPQE